VEGSAGQLGERSRFFADKKLKVPCRCSQQPHSPDILTNTSTHPSNDHPIGIQALSMGVHESQSLLWERMVALGLPFSQYISGKVGGRLDFVAVSLLLYPTW
jgi:hypothetical protein